MVPWLMRLLNKLKAALFGPCPVGEPEPDSCKDRRTVQWLVPYLVVIMLLGLHVLIQAWPEEAASPSSATATTAPAEPKAITIPLLWGLIDWRLGSEGVRFLVLALAAGALGGAIHAAGSLAWFSVKRGPGDPDDPDLRPLHLYFTWYLLRPVVAMGLAAVVQLLIVAGIFDVKPATAGAAVVAGVAALAGMFSARVNKKLGDIADTLFGEEDQQK